MAEIKLSTYYGDMNNWLSDLLHASNGVTIGTHDPTTFSYTYLAGTTFAGYMVTSLGTGFAYDGTTPIAGSMTGLTVRDDLDHVVLTVSNIPAGSLASDFALFANNEFGWTDWNGGVWDGQPANAWSQLLSGNDRITGTSGRDWPGFFGVDAGNDVYYMRGGNDQVNGGMGNDTIHGGAGWDMLDYGVTHLTEGIPMVRGATINVDKGTALDPYGFTDKFDGFEEFHGSATADTFIGGASSANFMGLRGTDTLIGGTTGGDWVLYMDDAWLGGSRGIVVHLGTGFSGGDITGTIRDGFGNLDHTVNIQNVAGTRHDDTFVGSSANNSFGGGEGKDSYDGGAGNDWIGFNWIFMGAAQHGIRVNLSLQSGQVQDDGFGNVEDAVSVENIWGSDQSDRIIGASNHNRFTGNNGDDTMTGGGGHDTFQWENRSDFGAGDVITDFRGSGAAERDVLSFHVTNWGASTTLNLVNGTTSMVGDSTFLYDATTHGLSWDPDGTGALDAIHVATLRNVLALSADNFELF